MKKIISLLLALVLLFTTLSVSMVSAEEALTQCTVEVNYGGVIYRQNVVKNQDGQILAPVTWLYYFGGMPMDVEDGYYKFSYVGQEDRGDFAKRIMVKDDGSSFDVRYYVSASEAITKDRPWGDTWKENLEWFEHELSQAVFGVKKIALGLEQFGSEKDWSYSVLSGTFSGQACYMDGLYLPIAELLPLLNADVAFSEQGQVLIHPHSVSLSQALYDLNLDDLRFVATEDIYGSDALSKTGYVVDTLLNFRIDRLDFVFNSGKTADYQELFKSYLTDNETYLAAYDAEVSPQAEQFAFMDEALGAGNTALGALGTGFKWLAQEGYAEEMFPDVYEVFFTDYPHSDIKGADIVEGFGKCYSYVSTYANQVEDHRYMLEAVFETGAVDVVQDSAAYRAAQLTWNLYGEEYAEKAVSMAATGLRDAAWDIVKKGLNVKVSPHDVVLAVLKLGLQDQFQVVKNTGLINYMDAIVETAYSAFCYSDLTDCSADALNDLRLRAMMTLVASRHAYDTLWDGDHEKIEQIDAALTKLYLASEGVDADSSDYYGKKKAELQKTLTYISTKNGGTEMTNPTIVQDYSDAQGYSDDSLVGTWWAEMDGEYGEITFRDDYTGFIVSGDFYKEFEWSTEGNALFMTGQTLDMTYRVFDDFYLYITSYIIVDGERVFSEEDMFTKKILYFE